MNENKIPPENDPKVSLVWITPDAEQMIIDIARVSSNKPVGTPGKNLITYLIEHRHWSPFEMANICVEITCVPRDITRQLLRHHMHFQEFSQRYADAANLGDVIYRDCRMQDPKNRQASLDCDDPELTQWWFNAQEAISSSATNIYATALERGIAKEVARTVLPEGMTPTRMYVNGTIRSWLHYILARWAEGVQPEHYILAERVYEVLTLNIPTITESFIGYHYA